MKRIDNVGPSHTKRMWVLRARLFRGLAKIMGTSVSQFSDERLGILQYKTAEESGEALFTRSILPRLLNNIDVPVFFNVGLNEGDFTHGILECFSNARIFGFEPNPEVAARTRNRYKGDSRVSVFEFAVSDTAGTVNLFDYGDAAGTGHASLYLEVLTLQHKAKSTKSFKVQCVTIDQFSEQHDLRGIDFIKIDTEGHELAVLRGASNLIARNAIGCIQFEFNEMNVVSRSFLKDIYNILKDYKFFRLRRDGLISLGDYNTRNEIFKFQNIVAIRPDSVPLIQEFIIRNPWK